MHEYTGQRLHLLLKTNKEEPYKFYLENYLGLSLRVTVDYLIKLLKVTFGTNFIDNYIVSTSSGYCYKLKSVIMMR